MINISIETTNAAFQCGNLDIEKARILKELAEQIENGELPTQLRDIDGNTIGLVEYLED